MLKIISVLIPGLILVGQVNGLPYLVIFHQLIFGLGFLVFLLLVVSFLIGLMGGWFLARGKALLPLKISSKKDRLLIFTPHPDDEALAAAGVLAWAKKKGAKIKVVYLTNGDASPYQFWQKKKFRYSPEEFIKIGERRMAEAKKAAKALGLEEKDLVFLGYPDGKISDLFKNQKKLVSGSTKTTTNPYSDLANYRREYRGENLKADLMTIINQFKPTKIFGPHLRSSNRDHRATALFIQQAINQLGWQGEYYQYLIHFRLFGLWRIYPGKGRKEMIYPPLTLWQEGDWFNFWLSEREQKKKEKAIACYQNQREVPTLKRLFESFLTRNEIFQRVA